MVNIGEGINALNVLWDTALCIAVVIERKPLRWEDRHVVDRDIRILDDDGEYSVSDKIVERLDEDSVEVDSFSAMDESEGSRIFEGFVREGSK